MTFVYIYALIINENRSLTDAVIYYDTLVVVRGLNGCKVLYSGECLVKLMNKWQAIPNLNCARSRQLTVVVCTCMLLEVVIFFLSSVEGLSSLADKWQYSERMQTPRKWLAAVSYQKCIYVSGGITQNCDSALSTAEKYNPIEGR